METVTLHIESGVDRRQLTCLLAASGYKVWESWHENPLGENTHMVNFEITNAEITRERGMENGNKT